MALMMKAYGRVGEDGKIAVPNNIRREAGLQPGQLVEVKLLGGKSVLITAKKNVVS